MKILGIETSCDETAAAIVEDGHKVLSNTVASQVAKHAQYGGVIPELAAREHLEAIQIIVQQALRDAETPLEEVDAVAVTQTPGLLPALLVGLSYGKGLAVALKKPFIGINHFLAHIFGSFIESPETLRDPASFPLLALVVSGGHTALLLVEANGVARIVGQTLDDAAGEAFDKAAKILHLPYPGGPVIDKMAKAGDAERFQFPRGLCASSGQALKPQNRYNFSFSGVKTALLYQVKGQANVGALDAPIDLSEQEMHDVVASYQEAIVDALTTKLHWAARDFAAKTLTICGGVACNSRLRAQSQALADKLHLPLHIAAPKYCTDNAAMIAGLGYYYAREKRFTELDVDATPRLSDLGRLPFCVE